MPFRPPLDPPYDDTGPVPHLQRPARENIPHTTHAKAALYLVIAPHITQLADDLWALTLKTRGLAAEPQVVAQAAVLLRDAQRLMRGEPGAYLVGLSFEPPMLLHALALGMRQLDRAVAAFRDRYYGYNPLADGPAWAVCDAYGNPDRRWLGPRTEPDLATEINELNVITAEIIRTKLLDLAQRSETPLPPNLQRRVEEPAPEAPATEPTEPAGPAREAKRRAHQRHRRHSARAAKPLPGPRARQI